MNKYVTALFAGLKNSIMYSIILEEFEYSYHYEHQKVCLCQVTVISMRSSKQNKNVLKKRKVTNHQSASPTKKKIQLSPPNQPQPTPTKQPTNQPLLPTKSSLISEGKAAISFRSNQLTSCFRRPDGWKLGNHPNASERKIALGSK